MPPLGSPPEVSVVIAACNHAPFIETLLRSVVRQTYGSLEVIVVDDGSGDATPEIAKSVAEEDSRVRVVVQENRGVVEARNRGVGMARGELVTVVDSDDLLPPERIQWQVEALRGDPRAVLVYGNAGVIDGEGRPIGAHFDDYPPVAGDFSVELWSNYCFVPAISVMFRRDAFEATGPFWGPGPITDYLKWIELGLRGPVICLRDRELGYWRRHGGNASLVSPRERAARYEATRQGLEALLERHPEFADRVGRRRIRSRYARCHFMAGYYAGLDRDWRLARAEFAHAVRREPAALNITAYLSTLPMLNVLGHPVYRWSRSRFLKLGR
jgi:glycosyltransferase involved in cell wall biosynthesis